QKTQRSSSAVKKDLANEINNTFLSPMSIFAPLSLDLHRRCCTESVLTDTVLTVSADVAFEKLSKLNPKKAVGPDDIPPWLLKENADLLAGSEKSIQDINNHLRPISLTPILSKLAEDFVVNRYLKPAVMERIDKRQFGTVPKSCTTHALISMLHTWTKNTDGNGSTTCVMLFDFRKAFDLIDHPRADAKFIFRQVDHDGQHEMPSSIFTRDS
ncbi:Hypothetical predicted protein, partial [Paramuricea clavata]